MSFLGNESELIEETFEAKDDKKASTKMIKILRQKDGKERKRNNSIFFDRLERVVQEEITEEIQTRYVRNL